MNIKIDINVCRVCLQPCTGVNIYTGDNLEKFLFTTLVRAEKNDGMPEILCNQCHTRMRIAYSFKKKAEESDKHLRSFILDVNRKFQQVTKLDNASPADPLKNEIDETDMVADAYDDIDNDMQLMVYTMDNVDDEHQPKGDLNISETALNNQSLVDILEQNVNTPNTIENESLLEDHIADENNTEMEVLIINEEDGDTTSGYIVENVGGDEEFDGTDGQTADEADDAIFEDEEHLDDNYEYSNSNAASDSKKFVHFCLKCNKTFSTRTNLMRHQMTHDGQKPYRCDICGNAFTQNGSLKSHMFIHTGERPYACSVCPKAFTQSKSLTFHMRRHTGEKPFTCSHCGMKFRQKDGLKRHESTKHSSASRPKQLYECSFCGKNLLSKYSLKFHMKKHETQDSIKCEYCDKMFFSKASLSTHMGVHGFDVGLKCSECVIEFSNKDELATHLKMHDSKSMKAERLFNCEDCNSTFITSEQLLNHIENSEQCSKSYATEMNANLIE